LTRSRHRPPEAKALLATSRITAVIACHRRPARSVTLRARTARSSSCNIPIVSEQVRLRTQPRHGAALCRPHVHGRLILVCASGSCSAIHISRPFHPWRQTRPPALITSIASPIFIVPLRYALMVTRTLALARHYCNGEATPRSLYPARQHAPLDGIGLLRVRASRQKKPRRSGAKSKGLATAVATPRLRLAWSQPSLKRSQHLPRSRPLRLQVSADTARCTRSHNPAQYLQWGLN
jgi:hypothetical protein